MTIEKSGWNTLGNFDAYEDTKVQRNLTHTITYFIFLDNVAADNKGRGWVERNTVNNTLKSSGNIEN